LAKRASLGSKTSDPKGTGFDFTLDGIRMVYKLADSFPGSNLFNADSLKSVNLKTGSLVTKALASLVKKEIIVKNNRYLIQDIIFKKWLQKILLL
jgi:hypothetical protein